jgi:hypothetical protein
MKCEFHVNDTFETIGGNKGFIAHIRPYNNYQIITICTYTGWYYTFAIPLGEFDGYNDMSNIFKHIGEYNFSKSDEIEEIKPLSSDYRGNDIVDTINELIEAVNELKGRLR